MFKSRPGHYGSFEKATRLSPEHDSKNEKLGCVANEFKDCAISVNLENSLPRLIFAKQSFDPDVI